ncbi:CinA family protein [Nocardioides sp. CPCC 205120]|uniref:CinA family protein n=1 Tax=Nocardioides sp. CPCC 205120 TaxID=3406462 RepID=UPI003B506A5E
MTIPTVPAEALDALVASGASLAVAESLTGGRLAAALTGVPGASRVFRGGVVAYATEVKVAVLGVPTAVLEADGVVSARCAAAMAAGVRRLLGATWGISTTGVAGPDGQEGHPPGTVFVGVAGPTGSARAERLHLAGDRAAIQEASVAGALALLVAEASSRPRDETAIG